MLPQTFMVIKLNDELEWSFCSSVTTQHIFFSDKSAAFLPEKRQFTTCERAWTWECVPRSSLVSSPKHACLDWETSSLFVSVNTHLPFRTKRTNLSPFYYFYLTTHFSCLTCLPVAHIISRCTKRDCLSSFVSLILEWWSSVACSGITLAEELHCVEKQGKKNENY